MKMLRISNYPVDDWDWRELEDIGYEEWMLEILKMNPEQNYWGNGCDYMAGKTGYWNSNLHFSSAEEFLSQWSLNDLNEVVNFHFHIYGEDELPEDEKNPSLGLQLWVIHPRKGASRGILIENIQISDIPDLRDFLCKARDRNYDRFAKLG